MPVSSNRTTTEFCSTRALTFNSLPLRLLHGSVTILGQIEEYLKQTVVIRLLWEEGSFQLDQRIFMPDSR